MRQRRAENKLAVVNPLAEGREFERDFFGSVWQGYEFFKPDWMEFADAVADVKTKQIEIKWTPKAPKTKKAKAIFGCVQAFLPDERKEELEMYCCLGTCLDYHHGCDCLMVLGSKVVTIDLSVTEKQKSELKADFNLSRNRWQFESLWHPCLMISKQLLGLL